MPKKREVVFEPGLIVNRKVGEAVILKEAISGKHIARVVFSSRNGNTIKIRIQADQSVRILREELD